ncbi:MAG: ribonuclease R [Marinilabiliaceae bacterium]|nr:ribonuclease R [Marinilabiliaceae bacterium]
MLELKKMIQNIFFNNPKITLNYKQVSEMLGIVKKKEMETVQNKLTELVEDKFLAVVIKGRYKMIAAGAYLVGTVEMIASGSAFVIPEDGSEDIFVSAPNLKHAFNGDVVKVLQFVRRKSSRPEGEVVDIVKRNRNFFVGTLEITERQAFVVADTKNIQRNIFIPSDKTKEAKKGQKVVVKISSWDDKKRVLLGEVVDVLGDKGENNTEMHAILAEFNLPYSYPEAVINEAEKISQTIPADEIAKRKDFRNVATFTIDPADAKDFDDALSIRKLNENLWEIGIHIADVTHYVLPDTLIDQEGYNRATSVYLVDRVVPMLPERLSNFLCSLRPNEDKLCFSAVFTMNDEATIKDKWFGRTIINSNRRFSYEEAQTILDTGEGELSQELIKLNEIAKKLREKRYKTGSIDFDRIEIKFDLDPNGKPLSVFFKESTDSNKLIEEFMLLANKKVAELIGKCELDNSRKAQPKTFIYRIHDLPNPDKYNAFAKFVRKFGLDATPKRKENVSQSINRILETIKGRNEQNIVETLAIRTMAKALYSTKNIGHYGLAFKHYTHFTSPIRRYPDMIVHRLLSRYLEGGKSVSSEHYEQKCEHSSEMEQRAADAERASIKYKQVEFLKDNVGQIFSGVISGISDKGIFVEIEDNKCEGMVSIRDMTDDYYSFDHEKYILRGNRTRKMYQLGDKLKIKITRANLEKRQLDFVIVNKQ